jgi:hypothetical protein
MLSKQELRGAWANWLSKYDWDWFGTLTFPGHPSPRKAKRLFNTWIQLLRRAVDTKSFHWVRVMEKGACGDNAHFHVLVGGLKPATRRHPERWAAEWTTVSTGHAHMARFDAEKQGGMYYLLKSLLYNGDFDIDIHLPHAGEGDLM